jgi:hypothetical protein
MRRRSSPDSRRSQYLEWSTDRERRLRRWLAFEVGLLTISALAALGVYLIRVLPLSAAPVTPPAGVALAWAGQQLRGYSETTYISAEGCGEPVRALLDLYRTGLAPEPEYRQSLRPGKVALAVVGDPGIRPEDVRVWAAKPGEEATLATRTNRSRPCPRRFRSMEKSGAKLRPASRFPSSTRSTSTPSPSDI